MEEITKKEYLEYIDKIQKIITIYHSDGKEHTICPMCGIDFEKLYEFVKELYTKAEVKQELDKAREEGARDVFTKDEWFMLKLAMNDIFNGGNRAYEDISNKIKSQLSKLTTK